MKREALLKTQVKKLGTLFETLESGNSFYKKKLGAALSRSQSLLGEEPERILEGLPFTTKEELEDDQKRHPPFGTNLTFPLESYSRVHQTSGSSGRQLWWLDTPQSWDWFLRCWNQVYMGMGIAPRDRIFFPFSFGPFLGFWGAFEGASRLGNLCIPGGGMTTPTRVRVLLETQATVVAATPTYALRLAEAARSEGIDLRDSAVRAVVVAGEPGGSVPAIKQRIEAVWGARCFDHCGMTEAGAFGFECLENPGGMHIIEDEFIVEVIDPSTAKKAPEGELVLTNLGRLGSPILRYRTGDAVRWHAGECPCGRAFGRLEGGILARLDDMVFVRGNNLYPSAVESILTQFPEIAEYRIRLVQSREMMALRVEIEPASEGDEGGPSGSPPLEALSSRVAAALEKALLFHVEVTCVGPGSLPRFEHKAKRFIKEGIGA